MDNILLSLKGEVSIRYTYIHKNLLKQTTMLNFVVEGLGEVKDAIDKGREVAGQAVELAIDGTESVLKATLGDETSEAIAEWLKETSGDVWQALLDRFAPDESTQEAANWVLYLLAERLELKKMTSDFFFRRKKPLTVLLMLMI